MKWNPFKRSSSSSYEAQYAHEREMAKQQAQFNHELQLKNIDRDERRLQYEESSAEAEKEFRRQLQLTEAKYRAEDKAMAADERKFKSSLESERRRDTMTLVGELAKVGADIYATSKNNSSRRNQYKNKNITQGDYYE